MGSEITVLSVKRPDWIPVADGPWKRGDKITRMSVAEFEKLTNTIYSEDVRIEKNLNHEELNKFLPTLVVSKLSDCSKDLQTYAQDVFRSLVLCKLGPFGFGVFAREDIPKGRFLGIYAGTIRNGKCEDHSDESITLNGSLFLSTKSHRGMTSYFQHLPKYIKKPNIQTYLMVKAFKKVLQNNFEMSECFNRQKELSIHREFELYSTHFDDESVKRRIQVQNVKTGTTLRNGYPITILFASRDIKAGEQLGLPYGAEYWEARHVVPRFFFQDGSVVPLKLYRREVGRLMVSDIYIEGHFSNAIDSIKSGKPYIITQPDGSYPKEIKAEDLLIALVNAQAIHCFTDPLLFFDPNSEVD